MIELLSVCKVPAQKKKKNYLWLSDQSCSYKANFFFFFGKYFFRRPKKLNFDLKLYLHH